MSAMSSPTRPASAASRTLLVGLLLFGLFFGAGNLIFPVELGRLAGGRTPAATAGFLVTAVGLPILGVVASAVSGCSSVREMVSGVSRRYAVVFTAALYLTIGPLFAIPRTATVSYEIGIAPLVGSQYRGVALAVFTVVFFGLTLAAALRPGRLVDWVGRYLTPLFLVLLAVLVAACIVRPMRSGPAPAAQPPYTGQAWAQGLLDGYNTMDALASLAFAIVIIDAVRRLGVTSPRAIASQTARSGLIAAVCLGLVYVSLAWVGATSGTAVPDADNGGAVLAGVARHQYGRAGQLLIAAIVLVACLKTAIGLVVACAEMFAQMVGHGSVRGWVVGFTLVSAVIANAGLAPIIAWSLPVLMFLYPLAVTAIILGLLSPVLGGRRLPQQLMTLFVALAALVDLVRALPVQPPGGHALVGTARHLLPGLDSGFGWVIPGLLGLGMGWVISVLRRR